MTAVALHLLPPPAAAYAACPRWCLDHFDDGRGRRHIGPTHTVPVRDGHTQTEVRISVEQRDDGAGQVNEVFVLTVAGVRVEMPPGRMHDLLITGADRVFWKLGRGGWPIGAQI